MRDVVRAWAAAKGARTRAVRRTNCAEQLSILTRPPQPADSRAAASLYDAALHAFKARDLATAVRRCEETLAAAPDHSDALHLRALVHLRLREFVQAEECARRAVEFLPGRPAFHNTLAFACRSLDRLEEAAHHYRTALNLDPHHVESWLGLAAVLAMLGRHGETKDCYRRAIALRPGIAAAHYNLGRAHEDAGEPVEAARCYRQALSIDPAQSHAWLNLGGIAAQLGDANSAMDAFRRALALRPGYPPAHNNLGTVLRSTGNIEAAIASFREAIRLDPGYAEAHQNLGSALWQAGRTGEATAAFEEALRLDPAYDTARFNLAALRGDNPSRPPAGVIRSLFDDYAYRFDAHLVENLEYRVPERLAAEIAALRGASASLEVLDLGCGTGLFGAAAGRLANRLTGVDLSARMLDRARARGGYDRLVAADIESFLCDEPAERYDLVAAADVFVYIGNLDGIFAQTSRVLRRCGLFAFSVESLAGPGPEGYRLQSTGRYAHAATHLRMLAGRHGFEERLWAATPIRKQRGAPVPGWVAIFEKERSRDREGGNPTDRLSRRRG